MIRFADNKLINFVEFLNINWPTEKDVFVAVLHGYDSVNVGEGEEGAAWAVYGMPGNENDKPIIMVAGEVPSVEGMDEDNILEDLAHEYFHHMQYCSGILKSYCEENAEVIEKGAEEFAVKVMKEWHRSSQSNPEYTGFAATCRKYLKDCTSCPKIKDRGRDPEDCIKCTDIMSTSAFLSHIRAIGEKIS